MLIKLHLLSFCDARVEADAGGGGVGEGHDRQRALGGRRQKLKFALDLQAPARVRSSLTRRGASARRSSSSSSSSESSVLSAGAIGCKQPSLALQKSHASIF